MTNAESPTSGQEQHLERVDFLVRKFTTLAEIDLQELGGDW